MAFATLEKKDGIGIIKINRPEALNALSVEVLTDLNAVVDQANADPEVKVVIITGEGKSFVAGADIKYMQTADIPAAKAFLRLGINTFRKIELMPKVVIAAINGFALGGGCELSMACDIRIASTKAVFGQPEVGLGIIPGYSGTQRLSRLVGTGVAKELILVANNIKADEAYRIGLVNKVVEPEALMDTAMAMAAKIASNAPIAVAAGKEAINRGVETDIETGMAIEEALSTVCFATEDRVEGMSAFVEKRKATFQNK